MPKVPSTNPHQPDFWLTVVGVVLIVAVLLIGLGWVVNWATTIK